MLNNKVKEICEQIVVLSERNEQILRNTQIIQAIEQGHQCDKHDLNLANLELKLLKQDLLLEKQKRN